MSEIQYARNALKTPDGTILESHGRHDYISHIDKNGETYMTDGGLSYIRRSVNKENYEDLSVSATAPFETIRESFSWGTYGKDGKQPLTWKLLKDMESDHIYAVLQTQSLDEKVREWMK
jgi:hypothetical protein